MDSEFNLRKCQGCDVIIDLHIMQVIVLSQVPPKYCGYETLVEYFCGMKCLKATYPSK
jgi:hypothetical protein